MVWYRNGRIFLSQMVVLILLFGGVIGQALASEEDVVVFAAASTTNVLSELGTMFEKKTGFPVISSFAGSGTLARQIQEGAPADIFISANLQWLDYLDKTNMLEAGSLFTVASNKLVLVAPKDAAIPDPFDLQKLPAILGTGRMAIGNPAHVPAGRYAKSALESLSLWTTLEDHLVLLPNVRAVLALVERGEVPFAIIYETDMRLSKYIQLVAIFPRDSHPPIAYGMAKIRNNDGHSTNLFYDFVHSQEGREIFRKYGFISAGN